MFLIHRKKKKKNLRVRQNEETKEYAPDIKEGQNQRKRGKWIRDKK